MRRLHAILALIAAAPCAAQQGVATPTRPGETGAGQPELVDEGVADLDSLATSLRLMQPDLRAPYDFDELYRVPGRSDLLMRQQGAITAVFHESRYAQTRDGVFPTIPPGTVFYIGDFDPTMLPGESAGSPRQGINAPNRAAARSSLRHGPDGQATLNVAMRASTRDFAASLGEDVARQGEGGAAIRRTSRTPVPPTLWTDESYRRDRLGRILAAARATDANR